MKRTFTATFTRQVNGRNRNNRVEFTAELVDGGFTLTFKHYESGRLVSLGCGGEEFEKYLPAAERALVRRLRRWHLVNAANGPMHYVANALYWAGCSGWCDGKAGSPPNLEHFKSTVVWGAAEGDNGAETLMLDLFEQRDRRGLEALLVNRLLPLLEAFDADMRAVFGL